MADVREPGALRIDLVDHRQRGGPVVVIFWLTLRRKAAVQCQAVWMPVGQKRFGLE